MDRLVGFQSLFKLATPFLLRFLVYFLLIFLLIPTLWKTRFGKTFYDRIYESETKFPQLFIYSTGDDIVDFKGKDDIKIIQSFKAFHPHMQR